MFLKSLTVVNYKNIREAGLEFVPRLNCFIGDNGSGKTNILDAVYYLSFTRSCLTQAEQMNVRHNETWFMLKGLYNRYGTDEQIICSYQENAKKQVRRNGKTYRKLAEHIGLLPLVMVSPGDSVLIGGGSDERRKYVDSVISQFDPAYLEDLIRYNRTLMHRNNLLKQYSEGLAGDPEVLDIYNDHLCDTGVRIFERRKSFLRDLVPVFQKYYSAISRGLELVELVYHSDLLSGQSFRDMLEASLPKDRMVQYTTTGIHKDDLELLLGNYPIKRIGSQGQQKTYLVALKLAQFEFISRVSGLKPILLLDDIFDKLDRSRVEQIVSMVSGDNFGQIFITDTNREHLDTILQSATRDYRIFMVRKGEIEMIT